MKSLRISIFFISLFFAFSSFASAAYDYIPHWVDDDSNYSVFSTTGEKHLNRIQPSELPALIPEGSLDDFKTALSRQIRRCNNLNLDKKWTFGNRTISRKQWCIETCQAFLNLAKESDSFQTLWEKAKTRFEWYKSVGRDNIGTVKFTGYFIPVFDGRRAENQEFNYPLYRRPNDLVRVTVNGKKRWRMKLPDGSYALYHDRRAIDWEGALDGRNLEIAYVNDIIKAFFLHVQGSGVVLIPDENGGEKRIMVNYAAANGRKYVVLAKLMKDDGLDRIYWTSMQGITKYFVEYPDAIDHYFPLNPSYIFFQESETGPYGSGATVLVPGHSIAIDRKIFPLGAVSLISTQKAVVNNGEITWVDFMSLTVNQDTGGAIKGAGRVDIFWGEGEYAAIAAGHQNTLGELYLALVPEKN